MLATRRAIGGGLASEGESDSGLSAGRSASYAVPMKQLLLALLMTGPVVSAADWIDLWPGDAPGAKRPEAGTETGGVFEDIGAVQELKSAVSNTELYFTELYWPDFDSIQFQKALEEYSSRQRRFGDKSNFGKNLK